MALILGEAMSEIVDMDNVYEDPATGDIYEDRTHFYMSRPLALGPLIFAKLRLHFGTGYEVFWNHFNQEVAVSTPTGSIVITNEEAFPIPRSDRLYYVNVFIEAVLGHE
jgi:hypothetical protein